MSKPDYPREILPQKEWKQTVAVSDILKNCPDALLGHLLVGDKQLCIDSSLGEDMCVIRRESLPLERMANLSCSLLGTYFALSFFHFLPDNVGRLPWKAGTCIVDDLLDEKNYNHYPEITVVGWYLRNIENHSIPYPRIFFKAKEFEAFQDAVAAIAKDKNEEIVQKEWNDLLEDEDNKKLRIADFTGESRCNHAPTMLNYWHYTIDLYSADDSKTPLKKISKGWREKMGLYLQDYLCNSFLLLKEEAQVARIDDEHIWMD